MPRLIEEPLEPAIEGPGADREAAGLEAVAAEEEAAAVRAEADPAATRVTSTT